MTQKINNLISHLEKCYIDSEDYKSKIDNFIIALDGMSGTKTRHFYNNLLNIEDSRYLEVGTWKGSSVCSAMYLNNSKVLCIDNWSQFMGPKDEFLNNFEKSKGDNDANFIEGDCFNIDISSIGKFNIYMYDGEHSYDSHYKALTYYIDCMDDIFIFVVDDWNWEDVRNATNKSIEDLKLNILWNKEILLSTDNSTTHEKTTWWNGIGVFLLQKNNNYEDK
jgi:hypothetical protein